MTTIVSTPVLILFLLCASFFSFFFCIRKKRALFLLILGYLLAWHGLIGLLVVEWEPEGYYRSVAVDLARLGCLRIGYHCVPRPSFTALLITWNNPALPWNEPSMTCDGRRTHQAMQKVLVDLLLKWFMEAAFYGVLAGWISFGAPGLDRWVRSKSRNRLVQAGNAALAWSLAWTIAFAPLLLANYGWPPDVDLEGPLPLLRGADVHRGISYGIWMEMLVRLPNRLAKPLLVEHFNVLNFRRAKLILYLSGIACYVAIACCPHVCCSLASAMKAKRGKRSGPASE